jgi:hypothetical protein
MKLVIVTLILSSLGTIASAASPSNSHVQKMTGSSAKILFAELARHETIKSDLGVQWVQSTGVVCIATNVTSTTTYSCLVSEDGSSQPRFVSGTDFDVK